MAQNQPTNGSTQIGICNGPDEGYATAPDVAAIIEPHLTPAGGATVTTAAPISGDGSAGDAITMTDGDLATAIGGTAACQAVIDCVETAPAATAADIAAIDGTTPVAILNGSGDLVYATAGDLGIGSGGGTGSGGTTPFTAGQNANDWRFNGVGSNNSGTLPNGPAGVPGYWHITTSLNNGNVVFNPGTTETDNIDAQGIAGGGATYTFTATSPGGSLDRIAGHWVSTD